MTAIILIMLVASCQPGNQNTVNESETALPVAANPQDEWISTTIVTEESNVGNWNEGEDGYNGGEIANSDIVIDNDTRWTIKIKIENLSETKDIESTGVIFAGNNHTFNEIDLFLGVNGKDWQIGYAPKASSGYEFFQNLGPLSGLEQEFQITISSDGKLLELSNESQVIFSRELDSPWFPSAAIVNVNIQNGPHSRLFVSNLIVEKKAGESADGYAVAEVVRPALPAPVVPEPSALISVENASQLTRLTSLGWSDLVGMSLSPDGSYLALNTANGVQILDASNLESVIFLPTVMKDYGITFLDDGRISARDCYQGYIWSLPDGEQLKHVHFQKTDPKTRYHELYCQSTPDAEMEYSFIHGAADQASGLYRVSTASPIYTLDFNPSLVVVSPDGKLAALRSDDKLVILNYADGTVLQETAVTGIGWMFFYPDSSILAAVLDNKTNFYSMDDFSLIDTVSGTGLGSVLIVLPEFSPDGSVLVFRSKEVYRFYRASDRALINGITGVGIQFAPDSSGVYIDNGTGVINHFVFNEDRSKMDLESSVSGKGLNSSSYWKTSDSVVLSEDNDKAIYVQTNGNYYYDVLTTILVKDISTDSITQINIEPYIEPTKAVYALWLPKMNSFVLLMEESLNIHGLYLLDQEGKTITQVLGEEPYAANMALNFSPESDLLVFARGNEVISWDLGNNGYWQLEFEPSDSYLYKQTVIQFSETGDLMTFSDASDVNRVFSTADYTQVDQTSGGGYDMGGKEAYSPDGFYLASISRDTQGVKVVVIVPSSGNQVLETSGYSLDFAFSPDSRMIAISSTGMYGSSVSIYDLSTHEVIFTTGQYLCEGDFAPKVAFSPDGKYLAILPMMGYPQLWGIR